MIRRLLLVLLLLCTSAEAVDLLPPLVAFRPSARALDSQTIEVRFEITKGYYLYRDKFRFAVEPVNVQLGPPVLPKGKEKNDPNFGQVEVYYQEAVIRLPVERNISGILPLTLNITSQGCADIGVCYPPQKQTVSLELPDPAVEPTTRPSVRDESSYIEQLLRNANLGWVVASFFGIGLLLTFTPCVFPMIPILSGIIVGHGHAISKGRALALSLLYVLGMAVTYAAAGVAAGLSGTLLAAALQNPWVLGGFALVFVVLAFSMFGFYELQLPTALQSKLSDSANHRQGGSPGGVVAMGALSALIVGPCVAAPLAGALLYIAKSGDAVLGGAALFTMALGMGAPLIVVGVLARSALPKPGPWMEGVRRAFGVMLLGVAVWLVSPVLPSIVPMLAWAGLLIFSAIYLHALDPLPPHAAGWQRFWKGVGVLALIMLALSLYGAVGLLEKRALRWREAGK